eukprot:TRINITY_DN11990_c0_g2_i2.p1 TRINITY_DN11990_c0_g2~~TRINITY_DN11990_c0_g2_i2.p1  ORF type:complete len:345 (+),score=20.08 TRINITY_DN11990_c0_g2_i2:159-1193(+)
MVRRTEDYWDTSQGLLPDLIRSGDIVLIKGEYIELLARHGCSLQRRQDIDPAYTWVPERALARWQDSEHFLLAVSHPWFTQTRPDPDCYTVKRISRFISEWKRQRMIDEVGVFIDYTSVYQRPWLPPQDASFRRAMLSMDVVYGHRQTVVVKLRSVPTGVLPQCDERGWLSFEDAVSNNKDVSKGLVFLLNDNFHPTDPRVDLSSKSCLIAPRLPPLSPVCFERSLRRACFSTPTDMTSVSAMYRAHFIALCYNERPCYASLGWNIEHLRQLLLVLPYFRNLQALDLRENPVGDAGVRMLGCILSRFPYLNSLALQDCGVSPFAENELRHLWTQLCRHSECLRV